MKIAFPNSWRLFRFIKRTILKGPCALSNIMKNILIYNQKIVTISSYKRRNLSSCLILHPIPSKFQNTWREFHLNFLFCWHCPLKNYFFIQIYGEINVNRFLTKIGEISSICFILSLLFKQTYNFHIFLWDTQIL